MQTSIQTIPLNNLALAFIPVLAVLWLFIKWRLNTIQALHAILRMLTQLLLIGYFLNYIFTSESAYLILATLMLMVLCSSWIALGNIATTQRWQLYKIVVISILIGGSIMLALMTQAIIQLDPWYEPHYMIPLGGMVFANIMTNISLAAERFYVEFQRDGNYISARNTAFNTAMIPVINSLFAVGLVSLPGMMTGQILSGTSPFIAARYQIMVMCMIFASSGISTACFLMLIQPKK